MQGRLLHRPLSEPQCGISLHGTTILRAGEEGYHEDRSGHDQGSGAYRPGGWMGREGEVKNCGQNARYGAHSTGIMIWVNFYLNTLGR